MKEKFIAIWKNIVEYINIFKVLEFYLLKFFGWAFILIGFNNIFNFENLYKIFIDFEIKKRLVKTESDMNYTSDYFLTFVFLPIIIGCLFLISKNKLDKKNQF
jgi:hypothetical protein